MPASPRACRCRPRSAMRTGAAGTGRRTPPPRGCARRRAVPTAAGARRASLLASRQREVHVLERRAANRQTVELLPLRERLLGQTAQDLRRLGRADDDDLTVAAKADFGLCGVAGELG